MSNYLRMFQEIKIKKRNQFLDFAFCVSGYQDSNLGPPAPKAGALTGLRYTPNLFPVSLYAEEEGFEPSVQFNPYVSLANWWFQPLTHPSKRNAKIIK